MKVVYLNTFGNYGGAAIAALRSLQAARSQGVDARLLAAYRVEPQDNVAELWPGMPLLKKAIMAGEVFSYLRHAADPAQRFIFSPGRWGLPVAGHSLVRQADVIHLHWTHQGLLSLRGMEKIFSMGKPVVITLHDQWLMTGGCYYPIDCDGYLNDCYDCPLLKNNSRLANKVYIRKKSLFSSYPIHLIAISRWMKNNIEQSQLLKNTMVHHLPNAIDTNVFKPLDKARVLKDLGFDPQKKRIGFVAVNVNDPRKGAYYLLKAIEQLETSLDTDLYELLIIGRAEAANNFKSKLKIVPTGFVQPDQMPLFYNAMDVFILPSTTDNLPNSVMEALSCGVPVVGFNTGGVPDMVEHKQNGYLAKAKDAEDLARGIEWVLTKADYKALSQNARNTVEEKFSYTVIGKKLYELYQNII